MVEEIDPDTLQKWLTNNKELTIVDIRTPVEYELGHIPGSINVPMNDLPNHLEEIDWSEPIVVVCPVGTASKQAARLLQSYEAIDQETVKNLTGGYEDWNGPMTRPEEN